jgi:glycerophosphoryl diester phosphodiesterase
MTWTGPRPVLVLSHRGHVAGVPENTLAAFEAVARAGVDGIETDVRLAADGRAVLFHDRLAPDGREVAHLTTAALSRSVGRPVPTLEEALDAWPDLLWMVEVKAPAAAGAVERVLRRAGPTPRAIVTSFHHGVARDLAERTGVEGGVIVAHAPLGGTGPPLDLAPAGALRSIVWCWETMDLDAVARARRAGYRSWVYGVETQEDHARALALPLAGLVTDTPERALA